MPEPAFQTSFIPKQHIAKQLGLAKPRRHFALGGLGPLIASTIFFLTLAGAGALYILDHRAQSLLEEEVAKLRKHQQLFQMDKLDDLARLHDRYQIALELINRHIAPTLIFAPLASRTLPTVQYNSFSYRLENDRVALQMEAVAQDYASIALQSEAFVPKVGGATLFFNPLVSNLKEGENGTVSFTLSISMPREAIAFREVAQRLTQESPFDLAPFDNGEETAPSAAPAQPPSVVEAGGEKDHFGGLDSLFGQ